MSTTTQPNEVAKPATVTQIMARIVLLANWNNLRSGILSAPYQGGTLLWAMVHGWHGHSVTVQAHEMPTPTAKLDAETMADLIKVAAELAPAPLVSDETIAEAEQISRMVAPVDLHMPQAECGCPIKGSGLGVFIDHCEACEAVSA